MLKVDQKWFHSLKVGQFRNDTTDLASVWVVA
jgi:hypothetical protein